MPFKFITPTNTHSGLLTKREQRKLRLYCKMLFPNIDSQRVKIVWVEAADWVWWTNSVCGNFANGGTALFPYCERVELKTVYLLPTRRGAKWRWVELVAGVTADSETVLVARFGEGRE